VNVARAALPSEELNEMPFGARVASMWTTEPATEVEAVSVKVTWAPAFTLNVVWSAGVGAFQITDDALLLAAGISRSRARAAAASAAEKGLREKGVARCWDTNLLRVAGKAVGRLDAAPLLTSC
jgi:hypothetical protein